MLTVVRAVRLGMFNNNWEKFLNMLQALVHKLLGEIRQRNFKHKA